MKFCATIRSRTSTSSCIHSLWDCLRIIINLLLIDGFVYFYMTKKVGICRLIAPSHLCTVQIPTPSEKRANSDPLLFAIFSFANHPIPAIPLESSYKSTSTIYSTLHVRHRAHCIHTLISPKVDFIGLSIFSVHVCFVLLY